MEANQDLGMVRAHQEETRCSICGAEINNDSWICTACDEDDVYFPIDMGE